MPSEYNLTPQVDETQEFIEIANDFSNPLDLVREAISNAFDAGANHMEILFDVVDEYGEKRLRIIMRDNGHGMTRKGLQSFFDLGNSLRRGDAKKIGEKGHGTKVYLNSSRIEVNTVCNGTKLTAVVEEPYKKLFDRKIPVVAVSESIADSDTPNGTEIVILGYNNNRRDKFTHQRLRDHILWFTKFGSIEPVFADVDAPRLFLKGLDQDEVEEVSFGHPFPAESTDLKSLFDEHLVYAPSHYCRRIERKGSLPNHPEIRYQAIFFIEGSRVKYGYNPMLRRGGYHAPAGAYTVQERYGLWLCKDFIPVQRKNEWITSRGSEYTRFHAFLNCQSLRLTANRGSVDNTPTEVLTDIESEVKRLYNEIMEGDDWRSIDWLESEVTAHRTVTKEEKDFRWRVERVNQANIAKLGDHVLVEPRHESGVYSVFLQVATARPDAFPFQILDYDTHEGIDVIVKGDASTPIVQAKLFYVEFKYFLKGDFNHSFTNLHSIVCWDTKLKHDEEVLDIAGESRKMRIVQPEQEGARKKYFLDNPHKANKIEVFVLKDYLRFELGLEFRPRATDAVV